MTTQTIEPDVRSEKLRSLDAEARRLLNLETSLPAERPRLQEELKSAEAALAEALARADLDVIRRLEDGCDTLARKIRTLDAMAARLAEGRHLTRLERERQAEAECNAALAREKEASDALIRKAFALPQSEWRQFLPEAVALVVRVRAWLMINHEGPFGRQGRLVGSIPLVTAIPFCAWLSWPRHVPPRLPEDATALDLISAIFRSATYQALLRGQR